MAPPPDTSEPPGDASPSGPLRAELWNSWDLASTPKGMPRPEDWEVGLGGKVAVLLMLGCASPLFITGVMDHDYWAYNML